MASLYIGTPVLTQEGDHTVLAAPVSVGEREIRVWFRVPANVNPTLTSDPFFAVGLIPAMALKQPLEIQTPISASLPDTANTIQKIFHNWFPALGLVPVHAITCPEPQKRRSGVGCFFSGGVDSLNTFLKHEEEITTLIYVHGFDVDLKDHALRTKVSDSLRAFAARTGKSLIEVETNLRDFTNQYGDWGRHIHGSALASVALLLNSILGRIYIPSSYAYSELFPWASHPLVDPLWSTPAVQIIHDGCEASRFEKVASIAGDTRALSILRVCWENRNGAINCGVCEKCLRTMTALKVLGALDRCPTFQTPLDLASVSQFELKKHGNSLFWKDNYLAAVEYKQDAIAAALKTALEHYDENNLILTLSNQFAKIVASSNWNEFTRKHRESLFHSLMRGNGRWMMKEILKENIKVFIRKKSKSA